MHIYAQAGQPLSAEQLAILQEGGGSKSGFQTVHQWLSANGLLQQAPGGSSCEV
jgi:hypothetical protein